MLHIVRRLPPPVQKALWVASIAALAIGVFLLFGR